MASPESGRAPETFTKADRILVRRDFLRIQARGRKIQTRHLIALYVPRGGAGGTRRRLGLVVSSKVGNAVERNRVKRWLREIFRKERAALPEGIDLVLIARTGAPDSSHAALLREFAEIARKAR